jgi:ABC-type nitrate/sulfonate/bicarbonate transport system substrate-binding protein
MVDSLKNGVIDGYCVGEPWNTIAVQQGNGIIAAVGASVWNDAPEKLLCVTDSWHARYPVTHLRLRLALMKACNWLEDINHRQQAAEILAGANFLDLDLSVIAPSLTGLIVPQHNTPAIEVTDFYQFGLGPAATPDPELAQALAIESMELLGSPVDTVRVKKLAAACFRPDLYHEAAACFVPDAPS